MAADPTRPVVGANGNVYTAALGTALPDAWGDLAAAPWTKLGLVSEDGVTWTPPAEETEDIGAWQTPFPVRIITTSLTTTCAFGLLQWDRETIPYALGGGTFEDVTPGGLTVYHPPAPGESVERALFIEILDTPFHMGIYYAKGRITERDDVVFQNSDAAVLQATFALLGQEGVDPYNLLFD